MDSDEIKLWEWCKTHGDYAGYLMRFPNGCFAEEAKTLLNDDSYTTTNEASSSGQPEEDDVEICVVGRNNQLGVSFDSDSSSKMEDEINAFQAIRSTEDYKAFLMKYPNSKFADVIRDIIKKREEDEKRREEKVKIRREAIQKERKDEDDLNSCNTIEDLQHFIETHPDSKFKKDAQIRLDALMAEPKQLTLFLICNIICVAAIVFGLIINNMKNIGITLLVCGVFEEIIYKVFGKKWKYYDTEAYLAFSAAFLIVIGAIVCFRVFITKP